MSLVPVLDAIGALEAAVCAVEAATDRRGRYEPIAALLAERELLPGLATGADSLLARLAACPGGAQLEAMVRRAVRGASADVEPVRQAPEQGPVPGHPGHEAPPGYLVRDDGVWQLRDSIDGPKATRIALEPVVIEACLEEIDGGDVEHVELGYMRRGRWRRAIVPRATICDSRSLLTLGGRGLAVHSATARALAGYLAEYEAAQTSLPVRRVVARLGWVGAGYVWGTEWIGATEDEVRLMDDAGWSSGYTASGTWEGWLAAIGLVLDYPSPMLALYAALAAPVLGLVPEAPNAILDWSGETSHGKTTVLRLAASCWGRPSERDGTLAAWDATASGGERLAERIQHCPLILDDTRRAPSAQAVSDMLYRVASGVGRTRATPDGLRRTARWRTILLSSGEQPATSYTRNAGARARTLTLAGLPWGDGERRALVELLMSDLTEHHGHAGPRAVRALQEAGPDAVRARYREALAGWGAASRGAVEARAAQVLALLEVGAWVAHGLLGIPMPSCRPLELAEEAAHASALSADVPREAVLVAYEWAAARPSSWWGRHTQDQYGAVRVPPGGWLGAWQMAWDHIGYLRGPLEAALRDRGYDPASVISSWDQRGWLLREGGRATVRARLDGIRVRVIGLSRAAIEEVTGRDDEDALRQQESLDVW